MTRDQALAIVQNIELIKAFASGKTIGFEIRGKIYPTSTICLSNFRSDRPANYFVYEEEYQNDIQAAAGGIAQTPIE